MARFLLALLLLLPLATPVRAADSAVETQLRYLEKDLDRLREEVKALPEARRLDRLEAEIAGLREAIKAAEKSAEEAVKEKLEAQDKRIGDLSLVLAQGANTIAASSNAISSASIEMGWIVGLLGFTLTTSLIIAGLYTAIKVPEQARLTAKVEARAAIADHMRSPEGKGQILEGLKSLTYTESKMTIDSEITDESVIPTENQKKIENPSKYAIGDDEILINNNEIKTSNQRKHLIKIYVDENSFDKALSEIEDWLSLIDINDSDTMTTALRLKGHILLAMGRIEEGIALYDDFVQRYGKDLKLSRETGIALYNKGIDSGRNTPPQHDLAINYYSKIVDRFSNDIELQDILARTLVNRGSAYGKLIPRRHDLEINDYEEVIRRCRTDTRPSWRDPLAKAFYNKGFALGQLSPPRYEEQVAAYSEVISHFGTDSNFRELVARALYFKGSTLETLNCLNDAVATYEDYLRRFADAPELAIQEITAQVRARLAALK